MKRFIYTEKHSLNEEKERCACETEHQSGKIYQNIFPISLLPDRQVMSQRSTSRSQLTGWQPLYYFVIMDTTPDISHTKQLSVVLRHFCGVIDVQDTSGKGTLLKKLKKLNLKI